MSLRQNVNGSTLSRHRLGGDEATKTRHPIWIFHDNEWQLTFGIYPCLFQYKYQLENSDHAFADDGEETSLLHAKHEVKSKFSILFCMLELNNKDWIKIAAFATSRF